MDLAACQRLDVAVRAGQTDIDMVDVQMLLQAIRQLGHQRGRGLRGYQHLGQSVEMHHALLVVARGFDQLVETRL